MSSAKKIVIIDDEFVVREALQIILGDSYTVLQARSAGEGLSMLSEDVGLVFLDYILPLANGLDVLRQIKKNVPDNAGYFHNCLRQRGSMPERL